MLQIQQRENPKSYRNLAHNPILAPIIDSLREEEQYQNNFPSHYSLSLIRRDTGHIVG